MDPDKIKVEEFVLEVDSELRFEIETKNKKVIVEVWSFFLLLETKSNELCHSFHLIFSQ